MNYDIEKIQQLPIHFIVGAARSGTTLLGTILNTHPAIVSTSEVRYTMAFFAKYSNLPKMPPQFVVDVTAYEQMRLKNTGKTKQVINDRGAIEKRQRFMQLLADNAPRLNYAEVSKLLLLRNQVDILEHEKLEALINKNPDYIFYVRQLLSLYPTAKIVACVRDPRSVVLSHKQHKGKNDFSQYMGDDVAAVAYFWKVCNEAILDLQVQYPNQISLVLYEELVNDKENCLRKLTQFLGISFHPNLLEHEKHTKLKKTIVADDQQSQQWEQKKRDDLHRTVYNDRLAAWKNELTAREIAITNHICHDTAQKMGYDVAADVLSVGERLYVLYATLKSYIVCQLFIINYYHLPFAVRQLLAKYLKIRK